MKKTLKITAVIMCIISILSIFSACKQLTKEEKLEKERGVSYDNIVFKLEISPKYGFCCGRYSIVYTLYADNRLVAYTGGYDYDGVKIDVIETKEFTVTDEQKQGVIKAFRDNGILNITEIIPEMQSFAIEQQLYLFDENGTAVHQCGGINPTENEQYNAVFEEIFDLVPYDDYTGLIDDTNDAIHNRTNEIRMEELGISFEHTIISYMPQPLTEADWAIIGDDYEPWFDINYTIRADGTVEVYTTEDNKTNGLIEYCTEKYEFSEWRVNLLLETIEEHMDFDHLYYTDIDATHLYDHGYRPASLLCDMQGNPLNGEEPPKEYAGRYMIVFHDSEGNPVCMMPAPAPYIVRENELANAFTRDLMNVIEFACPNTDALEEETRILMEEIRKSDIWED